MINITVIIPCFNHGTYIEQRINSVLNQTFQNFEIIILDDCSIDNSATIIEKFRNHKKIKSIEINDSNSGSPFLQWIKGIEKASGDWIWIAESDDYAEPNFLETAFTELSKYPDSGLYYCDSIYDTQNGRPYRFPNSADFKNIYFKTDKWSHNHCVSGIEELNSYLKFICTIINSSSALFKRELLINCFNDLKKFRYHGDWYCFIFIAAQSDICYSAKKLNICRMHVYNFLNSTDKIKSKEEYFMILSLLTSNEKITEKKKLIHFFTQQFIGFGIFSDGIIHGIKLIRKYYSINKNLCLQFIKAFFFQRITLKIRRPIY